MKAFTLVLTCVAMAISAIAQSVEIDAKYIQRIGPVKQVSAAPLSKGAHADALRANLVTKLSEPRLSEHRLNDSSTDKVVIFNQQLTWQAASSTVEGEGWLTYQLPVSTHRFTQGTLTVNGLDNPMKSA
jgi:hypothetical protein